MDYKGENLMESARENRFRALKNSSDKMLICPKCFEMLFRDDIEHFSKCPYCDSRIEMNEELEDFILKPVVDNWISRQSFSYSESYPAQTELN